MAQLFPTFRSWHIIVDNRCSFFSHFFFSFFWMQVFEIWSPHCILHLHLHLKTISIYKFRKRKKSKFDYRLCLVSCSCLTLSLVPHLIKPCFFSTSLIFLSVIFIELSRVSLYWFALL